MIKIYNINSSFFISSSFCFQITARAYINVPLQVETYEQVNLMFPVDLEDKVK